MDATRRPVISWSKLVRAATALVAVLIVACGSSDGDAPLPAATLPDATSPPTAATAAPPEATVPALPPTEVAPAQPVEPDGERILEAVRTFADVLGPRVAGSDVEHASAELIAEWLEEMGYDVRLQEFPIGRDVARSSSLALETPNARTVPTLPFGNSGTGSVSGRLVYADAGLPEDFPPDTPGAIALVRRDGVVFFADKVRNAVAAGAVGVVVYNNEPAILYGTLDEPAPVPVVGLSRTEGERLLEAVLAGGVAGSMSVGALSDATSYNVIAGPPDGQCQTVTGGHYDSVPGAPGASDNASGTATVLEIAAVMAANGSAGAHCFVLFGAEEIGLIGSAYYVSQLTADERNGIKAMLNLDMVGVGDEAWWVIGDTVLQERMLAIADDLGVEGAIASELRGLNSDHASFLGVGIPALMLHRWQDPLLHTPEDVSDRVEPRYLEEAARMGIALLQSLSSEG